MGIKHGGEEEEHVSDSTKVIIIIQTNCVMLCNLLPREEWEWVVEEEGRGMRQILDGSTSKYPWEITFMSIIIGKIYGM